MASTTKKSNKTSSVKVAKNPVGRPRKKHGKEVLLDNKQSFKIGKNTVLGTYVDVLIMIATVVLFGVLFIYFTV